MSTPTQPDDLTRQVFEDVTQILLQRGRVEVHGFGTFELVRRKPRRARNPRTGERIDLPAKTAVRFVPAGALKKRAATVAEIPPH
jgi:nucleoid DNA-binding protein